MAYILFLVNSSVLDTHWAVLPPTEMGDLIVIFTPICMGTCKALFLPFSLQFSQLHKVATLVILTLQRCVDRQVGR